MYLSVWEELNSIGLLLSELVKTTMNTSYEAADPSMVWLHATLAGLSLLTAAHRPQYLHSS